MATATEMKSALDMVLVVAEAIREAGRVPSGTLYALLCGMMSLPAYEKIIGTLVNAGLVRNAGHELIWIGGGPK